MFCHLIYHFCCRGFLSCIKKLLWQCDMQAQSAVYFTGNSIILGSLRNNICWPWTSLCAWLTVRSELLSLPFAENIRTNPLICKICKTLPLLLMHLWCHLLCPTRWLTLFDITALSVHNCKLRISRAPLESQHRAPAYSRALQRIKGVGLRVVHGKLWSDFKRVRGDRVAELCSSPQHHWNLIITSIIMKANVKIFLTLTL